jgi:hypothetical protein
MLVRKTEINRRRHRYQKRRRLRTQLGKVTDERQRRTILEKLRKLGYRPEAA